MTSRGAAELVVAAAATAALMPPVLYLLRRWSVLDHPNSRSSHEQPTPRGGGIGPAVGGLAALATSHALTGAPRTALALAAAGLGLVGLMDDLRANLSPLVRFVLQLAVAALTLPFVAQHLGGPSAWKVVFAGGAVLWLVAYVNAFNFMDGINGISAMQAFVAGSFWWVLGSIESQPDFAAGGAIVAGAALAFAPYNFPRARVFLGDVGSYFLGGWLAVLVVIGLRAGMPPEAVIMPVGLYLADTGMTLLRRVRRREPWYLPHRDHVYQRLTRHGWSHARVTLIVGAVIALCSLLGLASRSGLAWRVAGDAAAGLVLLGYLWAPRLLERTRPQGLVGGALTSP